MKSRELVIIFHYRETRSRRDVITSGRCVAIRGETIPWFRIARHIVVAALASLRREIGEREGVAS
jgi:hypothetical protein